MNNLPMAQEALKHLDFVDLCIGAAGANIEIPKPNLKIAQSEIEKAHKYIDLIRTQLARILLNEGGLDTEARG